MNCITIGDVHGRNAWKEFIYLDNNMNNCLIGKTIDKLIFVGDYVDSWDCSNLEILSNLKEIIDLKKKYPDNVILLWGNHDVAYLNFDSKISGFRYEMAPDLNQIFRENINLFQLAYQYKNTIWTHAGIHRGWWKYYVEPIIDGSNKTRYYPFIDHQGNIADILNLMFEFNEPILYMISTHRGGSSKVGGPLWADKNEIYKKPLFGYHQIVGHTSINKPKTYDFQNNTKVTFCDCLEYGLYYKCNL
jgi:predicted phosphodiesterase